MIEICETVRETVTSMNPIDALGLCDREEQEIMLQLHLSKKAKTIKPCGPFAMILERAVLLPVDWQLQ